MIHPSSYMSHHEALMSSTPRKDDVKEVLLKKLHIKTQRPEESHRQRVWPFAKALLCPQTVIFLQLFRRVAAALPGMESIQEPSKEGSILSPADTRF